MSTYKSKERTKQFDNWFDRVVKKEYSMYYLNPNQKARDVVTDEFYKIAEKAFYKGLEEGKKKPL